MNQKGTASNGLQRTIVVLLIVNAVGIGYLIYKGMSPGERGGATPTVGGSAPPGFSRLPAPPPARRAAAEPVSAPDSAPASNPVAKAPAPDSAPVPGTSGKVLQQTKWNSSLAATQPAGGSGGNAPAGASPLVTGRVLIRGTVPPEREIRMDEVCGRLTSGPVTTRHYVVGTNGGLANVFVYLDEIPLGGTPPVPPSALLDNVNCEFQPYVLGVQTGQVLRIRNSDPLLHNVHGNPTNLAAGHREFNFGQPIQGQVNEKRFSAREVLFRVKCDVHPWMFARVSVMEHPWFAVTDSEGRFELPDGIPPGQYTLVAAHPKAGSMAGKITVDATPRAPLEIVLEVEGNPLSAVR